MQKERCALNSQSNRSMLFGVVGGYLIYLAYDLLKNLINHVETTMPVWLQILVIVLFAGIGLTLLVSAWLVWKKSRQDQDKNPVNIDDRESGAADGKGPSASGPDRRSSLRELRTVREVLYRSLYFSARPAPAGFSESTEGNYDAG